MALRRQPLLAAAIAIALTLGHPHPARAGEGEKTMAEELFKQGRALVVAGRAEEGCPKLAESARLDPAAGTLLNLAECYEATGRIASAWVRYKELRVLALQRGQTSRVERATAKIAELEPRLPLLTIDVTSEVPGLVVTQDGTALGRAAWGSRLPVDPGEHTISAAAPNHRPWTTRVEVTSGTLAVQIPALVREAERAGPRGSSASPPLSTTLQTTGVVLMIVGGAATLTGLGFGLGAKLENDKARSDECSAVSCTKEGAERIDRAIGYGDTATVLAAVGGALLVGGVVTWLVGTSKRAPATAVTF